MKKVFWILGLVLALLFQAAAPALGASSRPEAGTTGTYIVQPGDSLYRIAARQNVDFNTLMAANGFTSDKVIIYPGQVLVLPGGVSGGAPQGSAPGGSYTVQPGDSLYRIAFRQNVHFNELITANGLTTDNPNI